LEFISYTDYIYSVSRDDEVHQINKTDGSQGWIHTGHTNMIASLTAGVSKLQVPPGD